MNVVDFKPEHIAHLTQVLGISSLSPAAIEMLQLPGHAFTALNGEEILGCAGVMPLWKGCGEAVAFFTPTFRNQFKFSFFKVVKKGLLDIQKNYCYHRIQMHVEYGFNPGCAFAERLGFKWEGIMPLFTADKRTMIRYGRVWI